MNMESVLNDLKELTGYSDNDPEILRSVTDEILPWQEEVTQLFYDTLYGYDPTRAVFNDGERPAREKSFRSWYAIVANGEINDRFWHWQWFVGLIHIRRGISNAFMLGMMSRVQELFRGNCINSFSQEKAQEVSGAFDRITNIIAGLIAEGYFQSYVQAMEDMSGQSRMLIDRMVNLQVEEMVAAQHRN